MVLIPAAQQRDACGYAMVAGFWTPRMIPFLTLREHLKETG